MLAADLPMGSAPEPAPCPHFPDRLHAFVWRNWSLVSVSRMAKVVGAKPEQIRELGTAMGLPDPPARGPDFRQRGYLTIIRRNWHLLPYEQLLTLLDWTPEQLAFTLREDDFLFIKLGLLKPRCAPIRYAPPDAATRRRSAEIARTLRRYFPDGLNRQTDPLFGFVSTLSKTETNTQPSVLNPNLNTRHPRFCYSYFALYGDPLLETEADPYPDGYLAKLAAAGVNGVWLQAVLYKLAPFPWNPGLSDRYEERLRNLNALVARAKKYGIGIYLYLNEPRAHPLAFYETRPELKGVVENDYAALCTSRPEVRRYLTDAVASISRAAPELAGFFSITASENLTNCWSHHGGANCPRCRERGPAEVIAEVSRCFVEGIRQAGTRARYFAWDWGWPDEAAAAIIAELPPEAALMSVSEWSIPIRRGGVESVVGEYSISTIGPGPRATRHWELARRRGLQTLAKIQAGNTWELSAVPYIPALENVARHIANLRAAQIDGLMLGWTLGGYPSPNLEVVAEVSRQPAPNSEKERQAVAEQAMQAVAERRFGQTLAPAVVTAWKGYSAAFREFPYHGGLVYMAPMQVGPANPLWAHPTGYRATMVGFPYDDLDSWRAVYPPEVFAGQFEKVAGGFDRALKRLRAATAVPKGRVTKRQQTALEAECGVAEAAAIHFRSAANQARFVLARKAVAEAKNEAETRRAAAELKRLLTAEIALAQRLFALQSADSRLGFEASNQYFYVPLDLAEKVLNCRYLLDTWLSGSPNRANAQ
jgi:hypothetical protein